MILLSVLIITSDVFSGEVILYGEAPDWSGTVLSVFRYKEMITWSEDLLAETRISDSGTFELNIQVDNTTCIFTHLGIYKAFLYVEPGNAYELVLPPYQIKTPADLLNPYFEEILIQMGIANINENDINIQMRMFDDTYEPYYNKHVIEAVEGKDFSRLDEDISRIDVHFRNNPDEYFRQYRQYKYAYLRYLSLQHKVITVAETFFTGKPILYHNPAYMELLNQVFKDYFYYHGRTDKGKKIYQDINNNKDYNELLFTLKKNKLFSKVPSDAMAVDPYPRIAITSLKDDEYQDLIFFYPMGTESKGKIILMENNRIW